MEAKMQSRLTGKDGQRDTAPAGAPSMSVEDLRQEAVAQRRRIEMMAVSPQMAVQRNRIATLSGATVQLARYTWSTAQGWVSDNGASSSRAVPPDRPGQFEGQVYDDDTGQYSQMPVDLRAYLNPWGVSGIEQTSSQPLTPGQREQGHTGPIAMPLEMVGDLGERMLLEWITSMGIVPAVEQNRSGHGLDMHFQLTLGQMKLLPPELQAVFSSVLSSTATHSRSGRVLKRRNIPSDSTLYNVILEVKTNSAQLSKAQRDSDKYVYKQSKTGFGLKIRQAVEKNCAELFFEVRVGVEEGEDSEVTFDFIRRDDASGKGAPKLKETITHQSDQPLSHLSSKMLGDAGEQFVRETLHLHGYSGIGGLQREGGQGVDVVAVDHDGHIVFIEVKTHLGSGKSAQLTKREKQQHSFVAQILFDILAKRNGYENVADEVLQKAWEVYNLALGHDMEARETRGERPVALESVNVDEVVKLYMASQARYLVIDVEFPALGQSGIPGFKVSPWKPPK